MRVHQWYILWVVYCRTMSTVTTFLDELNHTYRTLHHAFETLFWVSYMGDHAVDAKKDAALAEIDAFRSNHALRERAAVLCETASAPLAVRLQVWVDFFDLYQMSGEAAALKCQIDELESVIGNKRATRVEGYLDPKTGNFIAASSVKMRTLIQTDSDEAVRKACFDAREALALDCIDEYVTLVSLRNQFARLQGYADFYDYKLRHIDRMTKTELFGLFAAVSSKTSGNFAKIRDLAKQVKGLRKPWNFGYLMTGDFTKEEDQYFQFDQALLRWGRSFAALGVNLKQGTVQLDLLERTGKYNNGFCHWPDLVYYKKGVRQPGSANFTCTVVPGQIGSGYSGYTTLFHEGGHAAHMLNCVQKDVCLNHEYAPMTAAWAETHSMFMDTMFDSIEWKQRYALNAAGVTYPFELYMRKEAALALLKPRRILSIAFVSSFERDVYELAKPTAAQIIKLARKNFRIYNDFSEDSLAALNVPHIYSWESSCSYHGYGLAEMALSQWREYFYKKYGYVVDNPQVGKEMHVTWQWGARYDFKSSVKMATGKTLSSAALIKEVTMTPVQVTARAKKRLQRMQSVKMYTKPVDLGGAIRMVHGKKVIATTEDSFELMAAIYAAWVKKMAAAVQSPAE